MKRPTQADVAKRAGVSRATVSYVLNDRVDGRVPISPETRRRVLNAIEELGYEVDSRAQSLRSGETRVIGVLFPNIRNPHYWQTLEGIEEQARECDYNLLIASASLNAEVEAYNFNMLLHRRVDGLIVLSEFHLIQSLGADKLLRIGKPIVDSSTGDKKIVDGVLTSYVDGTKALMQHLTDLGHRRIAFIYGVSSHDIGLDRLTPYKTYFQEAGLPFNPEWVVSCRSLIEDGYQAATRLLTLNPRPTALIAINDVLAMGAMRAAADLGLRVPDDVSIAGYDDIPFSSYMTPRLTTVQKDAVEMGRQAFKLVINRLQNPDIPLQSVVVASQLIVRESTGVAPSEKETR